MRSVSQFEANLLRLLQSFLNRAPAPRFRTGDAVQLPPCLSRAALELVEDHLAKGSVLLLARRGVRRERHLRNGQIVLGRLWQRTPPAELGLVFSRNTIAFLLWVTALLLGDKTASWRPLPGEFGSGDRLLLFLAFQALRQSSAAESLRKHEYFIQDGLCRLAFPDDFVEMQIIPDWAPWLTGVSACILEALQVPLCERWLQIEEGKEQIASWQRMRALGVSQETALQSFAEALTTVGRWDLARFLLRAMARLLRGRPPASRWMTKLDLHGLRLGERQEVSRSALAFLRHTTIWEKWVSQARTIGYFDDGYAASQLWKLDWETYQGAELCRHAQAVLREVEPLGSA